MSVPPHTMKYDMKWHDMTCQLTHAQPKIQTKVDVSATAHHEIWHEMTRHENSPQPQTISQIRAQVADSVVKFIQRRLGMWHDVAHVR